jgi:hypothetical protein
VGSEVRLSWAVLAWRGILKQQLSHIRANSSAASVSSSFHIGHRLKGMSLITEDIIMCNLGILHTP